MSIADASLFLDSYRYGVVTDPEDCECSLLVIDLDSDGDPGGLRVPQSLPFVVVGVGRASGRGAAAAGLLDLSLTDGKAPSRAWVTCPSIDEELRAVASMLARSRRAALVFAQVLRMGAGLSVPDALLIESLAYSALQGGPEFAEWLAARGPGRPVATSDLAPLVVDRVGSRLVITLNRPEVHNAYNAILRDELCEALAIGRFDETVSEIVLRGNGPSFCSGGDLDQFGTFADTASAHLVRTSQSPARLLHDLAPKTVALLHGWCVGSGAELPSFVGRVIADPATRFKLPELAMGLIPGAGGTASLPVRIGRHRTAWMGLTGATVDAEVALEWGLVDEVRVHHGDPVSMSSRS